MGARQKAIKAQWIPKIINSEFWGNMFYAKLKDKIGLLIFRCTLAPRDIKHVINKNNELFWYQVLLAWAEYNFVKPMDVHDIMNQTVWLNSFIRVDNRPVYFERAHQAGLVKIEQLYHPQFRLKTYVNIVQEFGTCITWFQYTQLVEALPVLWRQIIRNSEPNINIVPTQQKFDKICRESKIANVVYNSLIADSEIVLPRKDRWERKLSIDITDKQFFRDIKAIYSTTIATKYRDFQYRLIMGVLVTNRLLKLWNIVEDDLCTFCSAEVEDDIHLFIHCNEVRPIWEAIKQYIRMYVIYLIGIREKSFLTEYTPGQAVQ